MKKIFDILPPEEEEKEKTKREISEEKKLEVKVSLPQPFGHFPEILGRKKKIFLSFLVLLLIIGFLFKISKVEIKIWPEMEIHTFETQFTLDTKIGDSDFQNNTLAGKIFEIEKTFSQDFPASGTQLKKAEGIIRLYNGYSLNPETWLAGTRFVSSDGKLFKSKDKIFVPPAEMKDGKIFPSFVDVPVIAAEPGSDYNIGPSHFSIPALKGTARYTKYYGESLKPMSGGGETRIVKKEDLENAQNLLIEKARSELRDLLKAEIPPEYVFLEEASSFEVLDKSSSQNEGSETEKFNFQIKARLKTITFKKEDIMNFAKKFILSQIPSEKIFLEESLEMTFSPKEINFELGKFSLFLKSKGKVYPKIDLNLLKNLLAGKSFSETKIFLENQPQIIKTKIRSSPFWLKNIPKDLEKIEIIYPMID